jgi:broad-specificity NMP kinase
MTAARASRSSVYVASSLELAGESGIYLDTNNKRKNWSADILDDAKRKEIWKVLEKVTGSDTSRLTCLGATA